MVFKKGHAPVKKLSNAAKKQLNDISDFYVKFGIKSDMKNNLTSLSYLIATLKKDLNLVNNLREKKAFLRKELYETLISLRLNVDSMERYMPSKEFEALKNKIEEISRYSKKERKPAEFKKREDIIEKPIEMIKNEFSKKPKPFAKKDSGLLSNASDTEKRELEMLKKDLEDISNQLRNKEQ